MRRAALLALALATAACGPTGGGAALCRNTDTSLVAEAIGEEAPQLSEPAATAPAHLQCVWRAADPASPRFVSVTVLRPAQDEATRPRAPEDLFEDELRALESEFAELRVIGGLGDAAVMGFGDVTEAGFTGGLIARTGKSVLVMRAEGEDPAALESLGRDLVGRM